MVKGKEERREAGVGPDLSRRLCLLLVAHLFHAAAGLRVRGRRLANPQSNGHSFMTNNDKLERVAARLDDISETLEEIKSAVIEGGASSHKLDVVQKDVERAADAIEKAVDPD